ncbi:MAG: ComEC/Rec2 family competence protein, partial [Rickettsiales bacterium]
QLSFAATLGILAYYEYWISGLEREGLRYMTTKERFARFWLGIITTSTIATAATAPFVLHHFEEFPTYSVLGNLLVLPIISFWIMPVIVGVMLLLPFGLAGLLFPLLEWGIDAVLYLASWVSALPFAVSFPPPLSTSALLVMTAGGLWLCLWQTSIRHAGWLPIVAGLASLLFYHPPDMVVSNDGKKLALRTDVGRVVMLQGQRKGFTREFSLYRSAKYPSLTCDDRGCLYVRSGKHVALPSHRQALAEDCQQADLTLAAAWSVYENDQRPYQNQWVLDRGWISYHKGAAFWIEEDGIRIQTVREVMGDRPWVGR